MTDDPVAGIRRVTFADHYADICKLDLPPVGSPLVERLYERAQHCLLYSWLDYELSLLAEAQAFSAFDLALKLRIDDPKVVNLSRRLGHAVEQGWITAPTPKPVGMPDEWQNTHQLLLHLRNDLMHGSAQVRLQHCRNRLRLLAGDDLRTEPGRTAGAVGRADPHAADS